MIAFANPPNQNWDYVPWGNNPLWDYGWSFPIDLSRESSWIAPWGSLWVRLAVYLAAINELRHALRLMISLPRRRSATMPPMIDAPDDAEESGTVIYRSRGPPLSATISVRFLFMDMGSPRLCGTTQSHSTGAADSL